MNVVAENVPMYNRRRSYAWNFDHPPEPRAIDVAHVPGDWRFCGRPVGSPLGVPAGPLLNGAWCLYYAALGFDVVTYKTVRSVARVCYDLPNLQPVACDSLRGDETELPAADAMTGSWAVSFGMPSKPPTFWREDIRKTRDALPPEKLLAVSVVGSAEEGWSLEDLADDYARCARWAAEAGADAVECNFSCPNVSTRDGQLYQQPDDAAVVALTVREAIGAAPLIVKVGHIADSEAAKRLLDALAPNVNALAMTNSIATTVQTKNGDLLFGGQKRGICGAAILDASLRQTEMVRDLATRDSAPLDLIGVGGASTADHVRAYLNAGAHAVHLATAAMVNPMVAVEIREKGVRMV